MKNQIIRLERDLHKRIKLYAIEHEMRIYEAASELITKGLEVLQ